MDCSFYAEYFYNWIQADNMTTKLVGLIPCRVNVQVVYKILITPGQTWSLLIFFWDINYQVDIFTNYELYYFQKWRKLH